MRRLRYVLAALGALSVGAPAEAKYLESQQFKANSAISIDPGRAYILVRSPGMEFKLLKIPTQAERVTYAVERAAALAKAKAKYPKLASEYQADFAAYRQSVQQGTPLPEPVRPIEPTEESFAFRSLDLDNFVTIYGGRVFDKGGTQPVNLIAVAPGTYRIYGQIVSGVNGAMSTGICLCMGSVQFDAAAGTITDMGTIHNPIFEAFRDKVAANWNGLTPGKGGLTSMRVEPADSSTFMPPRLEALPHVAAKYRAAGKIDNYFGVLIDRLTPLPGVLSYRRDEVIDERTGKAVQPN
jgi:hypothetical protein